MNTNNLRKCVLLHVNYLEKMNLVLNQLEELRSAIK